MRENFQRRTSESSQSNQDTLSGGSVRSFAPPETVLQASSVDDARTRNGNADDNLNDALTAQYEPHPNDPKLWEDSRAKFHAYGPWEAGPLGVQGENDEHAFDGNDVKQGTSLGNCFFLAALASIVRSNPQWVERAIEGPLEDGTYNVTLYRHRTWSEEREMIQGTVNISPSFIVYKTQKGYHSDGNEWEGRDAYARNADRDEDGNMELWVKLIEKAFAMIYGGWGTIDGGWSMIAMESLTGKPQMEYYFNGVPEYLEGKPRESFTRKSSNLEKLENRKLKDLIIGNLAANIPITVDTRGHSHSIWEADEDSVSVRDQQETEEGDSNGIRVYTWEEFRNTFLKISTQMPGEHETPETPSPTLVAQE